MLTGIRVASWDATRRRLSKTASVFGALALAALLAVLPHLLQGYPKGHSASVNVLWFECFNEQLRSGELLPRWLFDYWHGLGAPVFYFYAPLPFYLFSLVALLPVEPWGELAALSLGHALLFFLSGLAFYALVRPHTDRFWATVTAIGYMLAPYHYIDLEVRAAVGESLAFVWLPLILAGVWRLDKRWPSTLLAACAYAGLVLSHLPSALLAAPVIALCSVLSSERPEQPRALAHVLVLGVLGVALGAFYVVPALSLRDTLPYDPWITGQGTSYVATSWLLGNLRLNWFGGMIYALLGVSSVLGLGLVVLDRKAEGDGPGDAVPRSRKRLTVAMIGTLLFCWFMVSGLSWPLWRYAPLLHQVQFPWRIGVAVELCSFVLIALYAPPVLRRALSRRCFTGRQTKLAEYTLGIVTLLLLGTSLMVGLFPPAARAKRDLHVVPAPVEYRTRWLVESPVYLGLRDPIAFRDVGVAPDAHEEGVTRWERVVTKLPSIGAMRALKPEESIRLESSTVTRATVVASVESTTKVRVRKVYYPHWRLRTRAGDELPLRPDPETGLLSFQVPPGRHELTLDRRLLPQELAGIGGSSLALIAILIAGFWTRKRTSGDITS